jgi:hypothetical protein
MPRDSNQIQFDDSLINAVATGDTRTYEFSISTSFPLAVTLVWRDPADNAIQNKLHLRLRETSSGNLFTSDDINDIRNNVQKIVIKVPQTGKFEIEVEGIDVIKGIPELLPEIRQDYALVVNNADSLTLVR